MVALVDQIHALRIPLKLRHGLEDELDAHIQKNILKSLSSATLQKLASGSGQQDALTMLDPFQDSLTYLNVLVHRIDKVVGKSKTLPSQLMPGGEMWQKIVHFIFNFDPLQLRYGGRPWLFLINIIVQLAPLSKAANVSATTLLAQAIARLDPSCGTLTSPHLDLVSIALQTRTYDDALLVIDKDVHSLPRKTPAANTFLCSNHRLSNAFITVESALTDRLDRNDILEYYILGAMVYIGLKEWNRAKYFLEHVLSTPTSQAGAVTGAMVEAYKKWVLVSLMAKGKLGAAPKAANGNAMKNLRSLAKHYDAVAEAFKSSDRRKLVAEVTEAQLLFTEERNLGLIHQVVDQHQKLSVRRLGDIYEAVPLARVAAEYNESQANMEAYLQSLIADGHIKAKIRDSSNGKLLRFAQMSEANTAKRLNPEMSWLHRLERWRNWLLTSVTPIGAWA